MAVYLICSDVELGGGTYGRASHYIGQAEDWRLWQRLSEHAIVGSKNPAIIRAFLSHGANLRLVRVWPEGGMALERYLKNLKMGPKLCPIHGHRNPPEAFPLLATIRLVMRASGTLPSLEQLLSASTKPSSGNRASKRTALPVGVTPLNGTSSSGIVVSRAHQPTSGSTSSARVLPVNEASSSASTRQPFGSSGGRTVKS